MPDAVSDGVSSGVPDGFFLPDGSSSICTRLTKALYKMLPRTPAEIISPANTVIKDSNKGFTPYA